jgi:hypothetical protein
VYRRRRRILLIVFDKIIGMKSAAPPLPNRKLRRTLARCGLQGRLVLVEWVDSHHRAGWTTDEPCDAPLTCLSVGWLIFDGKHAKTLAPHYTAEENPQRNGEMTIPSCAITRMEVLL